MFSYGIVGTGMIASVMARAIEHADGIEVAAVASRSRERAAMFAGEHGISQSHEGIDALIADPAIDAIYLAVPNEHHAGTTERAIAAGKAVLCEKPLAMNLAEARILFGLAERRGVVLREAFAFRHMPLAEAIASLLAGGSLGAPKMVRANMSYVRQSGRGIGSGGGALRDSGCYAVCVAQMVFNERARRAWANATIGANGLDVMTLGVVDYGADRRLQLSCASALPDHDRVEIFCTGGVISVPILNQTGEGTAVYIDVKRGARRDAAIDRIATTGGNGYSREAAAFASLVRGNGDDFRMSIADSLNVAAAIDALHTSACTGHWATVEPGML